MALGSKMCHDFGWLLGSLLPMTCSMNSNLILDTNCAIMGNHDHYFEPWNVSLVDEM